MPDGGIVWKEYFASRTASVVDRLLPPDVTPQKVRDKKIIRDAIWGFSSFLQHEISVIDSPILQRIRGIHQTALAYYTYPSSTHNRFQHSLGAVALADKVLRSINDRLQSRREETISTTQQQEVRLAALLHDISHGPFSHGTEEYFSKHPAFDNLKEEEPTLFGTASAGEILGYFMITSKPFEAFWKKVVALYPEQQLHLISLENVAKMILGQPPNPTDRFLAQIINGPFDVDKLDYLPRNGYYTGLHLDIDVDRLLLAIDLEREGEARLLTIDLAGVSALEQLLFSKMVIFTSVYHHHKVRSSIWALFRLLDCLMEGSGIRGISLKDDAEDEAGKPYPNPFSFLLLDDHDILALDASTGPAEYRKRLAHLLDQVKSRQLLKRALVLSPGTMEEDGSGSEFARLCEPENRRIADRICAEIARRSELTSEDVIVDTPKPPRFEAISTEARIRLSRQKVADLEDVFPTRGWVTGYAMFKSKAYVLAPEEHRPRVGKEAIAVFRENGIKAKAEALELAKQERDLVVSVFSPV